MNGKALFQGKLLQRISGAALLVRRAEHADDVLPFVEQPLQNGLAEGLLSMNHDAHSITSLETRPVQ